MASTLRFDNWEDSNGTPILDGTNLALPSSALPAGSVLQVIQETHTGSNSTTSESFQASGLQADITPLFASSKILVLIQVNVRSYQGARGSELAIFRNNSIDLTTQGSGTKGSLTSDDALGNIHNNPFLQILDSPETTSSTNYRLYFSTHVSGEITEIRNDWGGGRITLMEIAG